MELGWLKEPTVDAVRAALRTVAPALAEGVIVARWPVHEGDPRWWTASAVVDERFVVKFAWAQVPAERICHQARVLRVLQTAVPGLPLPEVVASSCDPALLVSRRVPAMPFFGVRHRVGPDRRHLVARDLATVLAELHQPGLLDTVTERLGPLPEPTAHATTTELRARFPALVPSRHAERVRSWCGWADHVLAAPRPQVLVHGDFHGDNHLWNPATMRLRMVVDLETVGVGEPEFDLRCLPADLGIDVFLETVAHYARISATAPDVGRIMAWHLRTVLGDALWRVEAGVPLPDHRTPSQWIDDLSARFLALETVI